MEYISQNNVIDHSRNNDDDRVSFPYDSSNSGNTNDLSYAQNDGSNIDSTKPTVDRIVPNDITTSSTGKMDDTLPIVDHLTFRNHDDGISYSFAVNSNTDRHRYDKKMIPSVTATPCMTNKDDINNKNDDADHHHNIRKYYKRTITTITTE